jgi:hypothetical protein
LLVARLRYDVEIELDAAIDYATPSFLAMTDANTLTTPSRTGTTTYRTGHARQSRTEGAGQRKADAEANERPENLRAQVRRNQTPDSMRRRKMRREASSHGTGRRGADSRVDT